MKSTLKSSVTPKKLSEDTLNPRFCEECERIEAHVIDSRSTAYGRLRRYQCKNTDCNYRWTTYEYRDTDHKTLGQLSDLRETMDQLEKLVHQAKKDLFGISKTLSRK